MDIEVKIRATPGFRKMVDESLQRGKLNNASHLLLRRLVQRWNLCDLYGTPEAAGTLELEVPIPQRRRK